MSGGSHFKPLGHRRCLGTANGSALPGWPRDPAKQKLTEPHSQLLSDQLLGPLEGLQSYCHGNHQFT
ncbi:unnamed protein product [Gulo gulo]|uniref:Uncharacterized protein n=1 Tax=Gulo gulo TaxID=48420 RepID=A0A9X9LZY0_GULGU|nr:unnamed protein product [Gulo gulo]